MAAMCTVPAYGHLAGAFANFLTIVHDDSTVRGLKEEMEKTEKEIAALSPKVDEAERAFKIDQAAAADQLRFYAETGLDTWLALIRSGEDIADLQGFQWLIRQRIENYMDELNRLYLTYKELESSKASLEGHQRLLGMIDKNLQARKKYLAENSGLELEQIANYLDIDWASEVEEPLIEALEKDSRTAEGRLADWVSVQAGTGFILDEAWLNKQSGLEYFFRSDHVYIVYENKGNHVILLGQMLQNNAGDSASLVLEAGFYNGFYLPEELLDELVPFSVRYESLRKLKGIADPYIQQMNGSLGIRTK